MTRYQHLANLLAGRIKQGLYRHGDRLPSVRSLSQEHGVSISTVQQAYQTLETLQLITAQARSGYFVASEKAQPPVPPMSRPVQHPVEISLWDQILSMLEGHDDKSITPFSSGIPDISQPGLKPLWRELSRVALHNRAEVMGYDELSGCLALRQQIARLMLDGGSVISADDLVITSGSQSSMSLALLTVCQPGDIVALESPAFYGTLQMLRGLGIKVIEIPTDSDTGISVEALEMALEQWPVKGVILIPNCNNPLGFNMPDARKRAIVALAHRHDIVIFEDDVYGELATEYPRPRTIHSWDMDGRVILCSSFTKSVAPGLRVGWVAPGRYHDKLLYMKHAILGTNVPATQLAAAAFIRDGHYHRHVRRMRQIYQHNIEKYTCWAREYFPYEICVTRPKGGFMLWVELAEQVDMVCVAKQLLHQKIQVAAGSLFSASGKYRNCVRINCALPPNEKHREVMQKLGEAIKIAMKQADLFCIPDSRLSSDRNF